MGNWHCISGGQQDGPMPLDQLRERVRQGRVQAEDQVWCDEGADQWMPARSAAKLADLFPGAVSKPAEADAAVSPPPAPPGFSAGLQPHRDGTILALGIVGIVACTPLGPIAWYMGKKDLAEMDAGRMDPTGRSSTSAGKICGIVGSILLIAQVLVAIFGIVLIGTALS